MNRKSGIRRDFRLVAPFALAMVACSQPPSELLTAARDAENVAVVEGAREYAPEALDAVAEAREALNAELAVQEERWAVRRSYKQAETLAEAYRVASVQAAAEAAEAREAARVGAVTMIADGRAALEEVRGLLAVAPVGKGSAADLAAMRGDLDAAQAALDSAEASVATELYLEAASAASAARETIEGVRTAVQAARGARIG